MTKAAEARGADAEPPRLRVRLEASATDLEAPGAVAGQIPRASSLVSGSRVMLSATAKRDAGILRRLLGSQSIPVPRSTLCTALLVRGYVDIGADDEGAWGRGPSA
jgi:hypothetical protein